MAGERRRDAGRPRGASVERAVIEAALQDLAEHGLEGLSIARIADAAQVNKTSIYRRWPTKEDLIAAALGRALEDSASSMEDTGSLRSDLAAVLRDLERRLGTSGGRALAIAAMSSGSDAAFARIGPAQQSAAEDGARELIERARKRGEWDLESAPSPEAVFGMLAGAVIHRTLMERRPLDDSWRETVLGILCRGLAAGSD